MDSTSKFNRMYNKSQEKALEALQDDNIKS